MTTQRSRPPKRPSVPVSHKRGTVSGGTRKLPEAMARLAAGDDKALRQRRPPAAAEQVRDTRDRVNIAGTNNRDSRTVYDARLSEMHEALAAGDLSAVGQGLFDMEQLGLFRARNVVNFQAFSTSVVGLPVEQASELVNDAAARKGYPRGRLADPLVALWIRSEAALREHLGRATVCLAGEPTEPRLEFSVPCKAVDQAVNALSGVGRQAAGLAHHLSQPRPARAPRPGDAAREPAAIANEPRRPLPRRSRD